MVRFLASGSVVLSPGNSDRTEVQGTICVCRELENAWGAVKLTS